MEHSPNCAPAMIRDARSASVCRWMAHKPAAAGEDQRSAIGMQRRRKRMDGRAAGDLAACRRNRAKLRTTAASRSGKK